MLTIHTNTSALIAQRNLNKSHNALADSIARLSSGLRINSARDDAAGLAIANRMTSQIRGKNQALRNTNDAISMLQTLESGLGSINDSVQRIRELAVQKANGTNSESDRASIQAEIDQLLEGIDSLGGSSSFNEISLMSAVKNLNIQVGAGTRDSDSIEVNLRKIDTKTLGLRMTPPPVTPALTADNPYMVNGVAYTSFVPEIVGYGGVEAVGMDAVAAQLGVDPSEISFHFLLDDAGNPAPDTRGVVIKVANTYYHKNGNAVSYDADGRVTGVKIGMPSTVTADVIDAETGVVVESNVRMNQPQVGVDSTGRLVAFYEYKGWTNMRGTYDNFNGGKSFFYIDNTGKNVSPKALDLQRPGYIGASDTAINILSDYRSMIGAMMNRFESVSNGLQNDIINLEAARSRIQDADYSLEVSNMTRAQILQQAGQAALAQANQIPQGVLSLLR